LYSFCLRISYMINISKIFVYADSKPTWLCGPAISSRSSNNASSRRGNRKRFRSAHWDLYLRCTTRSGVYRGQAALQTGMAAFTILCLADATVDYLLCFPIRSSLTMPSFLISSISVVPYLLSHLFSFLLCLFITSFLSLQRGSVVSPTTSNSSLTRGVNGVRNLFKRSSTIDNENTLNENNINTTPDKTTHTNTTTYTPSKSMFDMSTIFENRSNSPTRNSPLTGINSAFVANTTMNNTTNPSYSPGMKRRNSSPVPFISHEESDLNGIGVSLSRGK